MSYEEAVWNIPLVSLMLMMRQKQWQSCGGKGFALSDIDAIDQGLI